jgi:hypothetical protein
MKKMLTLLGLLSSLWTYGQNITQVEYFIDNDLGYGNGTSVSLTPAATITGLSFTISVNGLSNGFHTLYFRAKNANNNWSQTYFRSFYKDTYTSPASVSNVVYAEYFVDTDPGYGVGTAISFTPNTLVSNIIFNVPVNLLIVQVWL